MADTYDQDDELTKRIAAIARIKAYVKAFAANHPDFEIAEFDRDLGYLEQIVERAKLRFEQTKQARSALFLYLAERHPQIAHVLIKYDGHGDEGQIDDIIYFGSDDPASGPLHVEDDKLEALLYDVWEYEVPFAFETNEGGFGSIRIYPANQKVVVEYQDHPARTHEEEEEDT